MKVYVVSSPCGFEEFEMRDIFLNEAKARRYIEWKENWIVEEVEVVE
jgi:hypothetical protein